MRPAWLYSRRLRYPERAEAIGQFARYRVKLEHWAAVSAVFRDAYQQVYANTMSRVLLVHGPQGSGKSLFCQRLRSDHAAALAQGPAPQVDPANNLWHLLVVEDTAEGRREAVDTVRETTMTTEIHVVAEEAGWLGRLQKLPRDARTKVRVLVIDNFQHERFLSELAGVPLEYYTQQRQAGNEPSLLRLVAQRLVSVARTDLLGSLFVCLSNDEELMKALHTAIQREHTELPRVLEVPLPQPRVKEEIVRTNLNRLNEVSYWSCLDESKAESRTATWKALRGPEGIGRIYGLVAGASLEPRRGPRRAKNRWTLVTLGASIADVRARFQLTWETTSPKETYAGGHLGEWFFEDGFARVLSGGDDPEAPRRRELFDSEFAVRWVALDLRATQALVHAPTGSNDPGADILSVIEASDEVGPSVWAALESRLDSLSEDNLWADAFRAQGAGRSVGYEAAIRARTAARGVGYSTAMPGYPRVLPDLTLAPYRPCELSQVASEGELGDALKRGGHVVEFTSFMGGDLRGIDEYLHDKVLNYAKMVEEL